LPRLFASTHFFCRGERAAKESALAPPGDTLTTAGPLAQNLSPKLDKRDLAKAMKLVADWQLGRMPAEAQVDWTWRAYDGFMAVPEKVAGDKYRQAMLGIAEQLKWQSGPRVMLPTTRPWPDVYGAVLPA